MDKNAVALLRDEAYTVRVRFYSDRTTQDDRNVRTLLGPDVEAPLGDKTYTYVTNIPGIKKGDHVVVEVQTIPKVVRVVAVDPIVKITPNDDRTYNWIVSKIDYAPYEKLLAENEMLMGLVTDAYQRNLKRSFRDIVMAGMAEADRLQLTNLLEKKQ